MFAAFAMGLYFRARGMRGCATDIVGTMLFISILLVVVAFLLAIPA